MYAYGNEPKSGFFHIGFFFSQIGTYWLAEAWDNQIRKGSISSRSNAGLIYFLSSLISQTKTSRIYYRYVSADLDDYRWLLEYLQVRVITHHDSHLNEWMKILFSVCNNDRNLDWAKSGTVT